MRFSYYAMQSFSFCWEAEKISKLESTAKDSILTEAYFFLSKSLQKFSYSTLRVRPTYYECPEGMFFLKWKFSIFISLTCASKFLLLLHATRQIIYLHPVCQWMAFPWRFKTRSSFALLQIHSLQYR